MIMFLPGIDRAVCSQPGACEIDRGPHRDQPAVGRANEAAPRRAAAASWPGLARRFERHAKAWEIPVVQFDSSELAGFSRAVPNHEAPIRARPPARQLVLSEVKRGAGRVVDAK